jgi:hypothetical protein
VHDALFLDFKWREAGSAGVALALSPWFTRAWTALELQSSQRVKVAFKNPDESSSLPLLKDLDDDIFAYPAYAHPAHVNASKLIRKLRPGEPIGLYRLLDVLHPRRLAWPHDRIKVAAFMSGMENVEVADTAMRYRSCRQALTPNS